VLTGRLMRALRLANIAALWQAALSRSAGDITGLLQHWFVASILSLSSAGHAAGPHLHLLYGAGTAAASGAGLAAIQLALVLEAGAAGL
jgi:hypothetical protein